MPIKLLDAYTRPSRALAITAAALGLSFLVTTGAVAAVSQPTRPKPTIVLVRGAWAYASSWNRVTRRLPHEGYTVMAPANPLLGSLSDATYVDSVLATVSGPNTRFMAQRAAPSHTVEIDASHAVLLSHPDAVVDLIHKAVRGI